MSISNSMRAHKMILNVCFKTGSVHIEQACNVFLLPSNTYTHISIYMTSSLRWGLLFACLWWSLIKVLWSKALCWLLDGLPNATTVISGRLKRPPAKVNEYLLSRFYIGVVLLDKLPSSQLSSPICSNMQSVYYDDK